MAYRGGTIGTGGTRTARAFRVSGIALRGCLAVLLVWQAAVYLLDPPRFLLPSPALVGETLLARLPMLWPQALLTFAEAGLGLLFGSLAGILAAFLVVASPRVGALAWPVLLVLQALPVFAIAPLLVLWFGFGMASKVVMAALVLFFPVASAFADGLRRTERDLVEAAELAGATPFQTLMRLRLPLAMPALASGLRVAAPLAPLGAVIGEWVGATGGLGFVMIQANARMQTDLLFAAFALLAVLTLVLRVLVDEFVPLLAPWARSI